MKIIGMILVFVSCTGIGVMYSYISKKRVQDLCEWKKGLILLKNEINYSLTPLPEAFESVSRRTLGEISLFFQKMSELLRTSGKTMEKLEDSELSRILKESCLNEKDIKMVVEFVKNLGLGDKESQISNICLQVENLEQEIETAKEQEKSNGKLFKTLGVLTGIFIIVIFI